MAVPKRKTTKSRSGKRRSHINVSGKNCIKMADLRVAFALLGFDQVKTYIQSGNIIFKSSYKSIICSLNALTICFFSIRKYILNN